jgi:hypothetical protein
MNITRADLEALAGRQRVAHLAGRPVPALPVDWDLRGADLIEADLSGADLIEADLSRASLIEAVLCGSILRCTTLIEALLCSAALRDADLTGAVLRKADLLRADLTGAVLRDADLSGADLRGAKIAEGVIAATAAGKDGGYFWHALRLTDGAVILQYGCDRATLKEWRTRGPEYGDRHYRPPQHWAEGPAVAIAAAAALAAR